MATVLNKKLLRESTEKYKDREIMVTLTEDQKINLKLKGLKTGDVEVGILELFKDLKGIKDGDNKSEGPVSISNGDKPKGKSGQMVNLNDFLNQLRGMNAISTLDVQTMSKFDGIIKETIDKFKEK